jgi:DNA repair exonuclease SbcCD ATPase subunit
MTFALYGSVARYEDEGLIYPVITQGKLEARVQMDFAVGEAHFTVVRVVQRMGAAGGKNGAPGATKHRAVTKEARLETSDGRTLAGTV